jgi:hypothetical protein
LDETAQRATGIIKHATITTAMNHSASVPAFLPQSPPPPLQGDGSSLSFPAALGLGHSILPAVLAGTGRSANNSHRNPRTMAMSSSQSQASLHNHRRNNSTFAFTGVAPSNINSPDNIKLNSSGWALAAKAQNHQLSNNPPNFTQLQGSHITALSPQPKISSALSGPNKQSEAKFAQLSLDEVTLANTRNLQNQLGTQNLAGKKPRELGALINGLVSQNILKLQQKHSKTTQKAEKLEPLQGTFPLHSSSTAREEKISAAELDLYRRRSDSPTAKEVAYLQARAKPLLSENNILLRTANHAAELRANINNLELITAAFSDLIMELGSSKANLAKLLMKLKETYKTLFESLIKIIIDMNNEYHSTLHSYIDDFNVLKLKFDSKIEQLTQRISLLAQLSSSKDNLLALAEENQQQSARELDGLRATLLQGMQQIQLKVEENSLRSELSGGSPSGAAHSQNSELRQQISVISGLSTDQTILANELNNCVAAFTTAQESSEELLRQLDQLLNTGNIKELAEDALSAESLINSIDNPLKMGKVVESGSNNGSNSAQDTSNSSNQGKNHSNRLSALRDLTLSQRLEDRWTSSTQTEEFYTQYSMIFALQDLPAVPGTLLSPNQALPTPNSASLFFSSAQSFGFGSAPVLTPLSPNKGPISSPFGFNAGPNLAPSALNLAPLSPRQRQPSLNWPTFAPSPAFPSQLNGFLLPAQLRRYLKPLFDQTLMASYNSQHSPVLSSEATAQNNEQSGKIGPNSPKTAQDSENAGQNGLPTRFKRQVSDDERFARAVPADWKLESQIVEFLSVPQSEIVGQIMKVYMGISAVSYKLALVDYLLEFLLENSSSSLHAVKLLGQLIVGITVYSKENEFIRHFGLFLGLINPQISAVEANQGLSASEFDGEVLDCYVHSLKWLFYSKTVSAEEKPFEYKQANSLPPLPHIKFLPIRTAKHYLIEFFTVSVTKLVSIQAENQQLLEWLEQQQRLGLPSETDQTGAHCMASSFFLVTANLYKKLLRQDITEKLRKARVEFRSTGFDMSVEQFRILLKQFNPNVTDSLKKGELLAIFKKVLHAIYEAPSTNNGSTFSSNAGSSSFSSDNPFMSSVNILLPLLRENRFYPLNVSQFINF